MKDYDEEMAEYCKTEDFSCLAAPAAGQEVLALPDRAGHLRRLRGPGHLHLLCLLRRGLLDQDPHPAGTGPVVGVYNIYHYLPLSTCAGITPPGPGPAASSSSAARIRASRRRLCPAPAETRTQASLSTTPSKRIKTADACAES